MTTPVTTPVLLQTTAPTAIPQPTGLGDLSLVGLLTLAGGWLGRHLWEHISNKDKAEAQLLKTLIEGLQANQQLLLQQIQSQSADHREMMRELAATVRDLKEAVDGMSRQMGSREP